MLFKYWALQGQNMFIIPTTNLSFLQLFHCLSKKLISVIVQRHLLGEKYLLLTCLLARQRVQNAMLTK